MTEPNPKKYPLDELSCYFLQIRSGRSGAPPQEISLRQIFNSMARDSGIRGMEESVQQGQKVFIKCKKTPAVEMGRAFLIAKFPGLYADFVAGWPGTSRRFLIDENLSMTLAGKLWKDFGRATHTNLENLGGRKDQEVWRWAVHNNIDAIISCDMRMRDHEKDISLIAVHETFEALCKAKHAGVGIDTKSLPLIIQIETISTENATDILEKHKEFVLKNVRTRTTPYIYLTNDLTVCGPSYDDIREKDWNGVLDTIKAIKAAAVAMRPRKTPPSSSPS